MAITQLFSGRFNNFFSFLKDHFHIGNGLSFFIFDRIIFIGQTSSGNLLALIRTIFCILFVSVLIIGCRKNDNPKVPDFTRVPIPLLTLDPTSDIRIPGVKPESFEAKFTIDLYFKNGEQPKHLDLVVVKNHDATNAKTVLANISSWPIAYTVTGQQLIDLFGEPIVPGDVFEFSANVTTQSGFKFFAFPQSGGTAFSPGIFNMPGSSPVLSFAAPCVFDIDLYKGDFIVDRDDWGDYQEGESITITVIDNTHLSFKYKADDAVPIIMEIDPLTNAVTIDSQLYGSYSGDDYFAESIPGDESSVDPCTSSISVNIHHTTSVGMFDGVIVMKRK